MSRKIRILIVEDEEAIRCGLVDVMVYHGFDVTEAADGDTGLKLGISGKFDLILLDVMLPGVNGFEICNQIRQRDREQAIIMLTAKSSDEDIIHGLKLGADDYVTKPFSIAQLVLRVEAVLRRANFNMSKDKNIQIHSNLIIDTENLTGSLNGDNISFTRREIELIQYLKNNSDRPIPRSELLVKVWGYAKDMDIETRTVDIHIAKIRRKIENNPSQPTYLTTVHGVGYKLITDN